MRVRRPRTSSRHDHHCLFKLRFKSACLPLRGAMAPKWGRGRRQKAVAPATPEAEIRRQPSSAQPSDGPRAERQTEAATTATSSRSRSPPRAQRTRSSPSWLAGIEPWVQAQKSGRDVTLSNSKTRGGDPRNDHKRVRLRPPGYACDRLGGDPRNDHMRVRLRPPGYACDLSLIHI